ncbi:TPA: ATP-binding protein, partial [Vibrio cholerae]|nr:ATP-binding protein [Vibrio cholerae]
SDNSIVCIDEPEISLHPKWQKEFMKILIEFFNGYKECHFIIATHSPLIISELSKDNCYILNMDFGYAEKSVEYKSMSSDYQLVEVFGVAGNNNEYLNRIVVSLLSKLSSKGNLDKEEVVRLQTLIEMSHGMDNNDKVKQLINILALAWNKVELNAK